MHPNVQLIDDALKHLEPLIKQFPKEAKLRFDEAICYVSRRDFDKAGQSLEAAIEAGPDYLDAYSLLADLLRQRNEPRSAEKIITQLVERNATAPGAHLRAAAFFTSIDQPAKADAALQRARQTAPDDPEVMLATARTAEQQGIELVRIREQVKQGEAKLAEARAEFERGIQLHGKFNENAAKSTEPGVQKQRRVVSEFYRGLIGCAIREARIPDAETITSTALAQLPEQIILQLAQIEVLLLARKYELAEEKLAALRSREVAIPELDYFEARIAAGRSDWLAVTKRLEATVPSIPNDLSLFRQASFLLGEAWQRLFQFDRAVQAYRQAIAADPRDPLWGKAVIATADCLAELGQNRESIQTYERASILTNQVYLPIARLKLFETLRLADKDRNWDVVEQLIQKAPESLDREMLSSDVQVLRGQTEIARKKLTELRTKYPDSPQPWVGLAYLDGGRGTPASAEPILKEATQLLGDRIEFRLARIRLLTKGSEATLKELTSKTDSISSDDRIRLLQSAAQKALEWNSKDLAKQLWQQLSQELPNHLGVLLTRFELALNENSGTEGEELLTAIERVDGKTGTLHQACRAMYLIWKAQQKEAVDLDEAVRLLTAVEQKRPGWSRISANLGIVHELRQQPELAITSYQRAIDLGDRTPAIIRRLIELYYERRRFVEVDRILASIPNVTEIASLRQIVAEVSINSKNYERALDFAGRAVSEDSDNPQDLLWLARVNYLSGKLPEAEQLLKKAVQKGPQVPTTWMGLVQFLMSQKRTDEAAKALDDAIKVLDPTKNALVFAQGYELVNRLDQAREIYAKLLASNPGDVAVLRAAANLTLREGKIADTERHLEQILKSETKTPEDEKFAKSLLAMLWASNPDYDKSRRALELLGLVEGQVLGSTNQNRGIDDLRAQAIALALQRDRKARTEAVRLLENVDRTRPLSAEDSFLLAQLQFRLGDWNAARIRLRRLVETNPENPLVVGYLAEVLLKNKLHLEAKPLVERLLRTQPENPVAVTLGIRLQVALGKKELGFEAAKEWIGKSTERSLSMAALFEELKCNPEAESLYRDFARSSQAPQAVLPLASFLGKTRRLEECLFLLTTTLGKIPPEQTCGTAVEALYAAEKAPKLLLVKVKGWITAALEKNSRSVGLLHQLAAVQNLAEDYAEATKVYRMILELEPKNALAYNNLAVLTALYEKKIPSALELIHAGKKAVGPIAELLDTEGMILVLSRQHERAVELLNDSLGDQPTAAGYFHLAEAYLGQNRDIDAKLALKRGINLGLQVSDLHPLEKQNFLGMAGRFKELFTESKASNP